ncbi:uncharacterized protein LOC114324434 isoform X2 [Diabrotica virgifera virgifera]|uniref:Uncharacterized protein n=1 Tax=Diabrotica virgifera virgifera TaxID=50390 RepID=A0ABM5I9N4_DIAVI|nr:uncharacterized protein LOC114324434 isoform X2 [Diabrotica virgifera virgifera]
MSCLLHMSCRVVFIRGGVFSSGSPILGNVIVQSAGNVEDITCRLLRIEETHWGVNHGVHKFVLKEIKLTKVLRFNVGDLIFPFKFNLPSSGIPSSYTHKNGTVKYFVSVLIRGPVFSELTAMEQLQVNATIDIVQRPKVPLYAHAEQESEFCFCYTFHDDMNLTASLEDDTFFLGETMIIRVDIGDEGPSENVEITAQLFLRTRFTALQPKVKYNYEDKLVPKASAKGISSRAQKTIYLQLQIPAQMKIPNFWGCKLFYHFYYLQVQAVLGNRRNIVLNIEDIHVCHRRIISNEIGFAQDVVPSYIAPELDLGFPLVPVAQAPSGAYPPTTVNAPYPLGFSSHPLYPRHTNTINMPLPVLPPPPFLSINRNGSMNRNSGHRPYSSSYPTERRTITAPLAVQENFTATNDNSSGLPSYDEVMKEQHS